jgi:hypothetical protein
MDEQANAEGNRSDTTKLAALLIGWILTLGAAAVRIPQILQIRQRQSVEGIALSMPVADAVSNGLAWATHFANGSPLNEQLEHLFDTIAKYVVDSSITTQ